ncbi:MAG: hypothetical protein ACOYKZ_01305 [Chlamydiia bacterium]
MHPDEGVERPATSGWWILSPSVDGRILRAMVPTAPLSARGVAFGILAGVSSKPVEPCVWRWSAKSSWLTRSVWNAEIPRAGTVQRLTVNVRGEVNADCGEGSSATFAAELEEVGSARGT